MLGGFTHMSKTFVIILAVIAVVILAIGVPNFIKARSVRSAAPCINRLRQIDGAKNEWALNYNKTSNDVPTWPDLYPFLGRDFTNMWFTNGVPVCPDGGTYILGRVGKLPTCSLGKQDYYHRLPE
ncbi:MAG: hypothetical protein ACLQU6_02035 [Limisphaerales bacterium]